MLRSVPSVLLISVLLSGCAANPIDVSGILSPSDYEMVFVVDERSGISRKGGLESLMDNHEYFGDDMFNPSKIALFRGAVAEVYDVLPESIVLRKFDVIDSFPVRAQAAQAAGMASVTYAGAIMMQPDPEDSDYMICDVEAVVDGTEISGAAYEKYEAEPFGEVNVWNQTVVREAVKNAIASCLEDWKKQAEDQRRNL